MVIRKEIRRNLAYKNLAMPKIEEKKIRMERKVYLPLKSTFLIAHSINMKTE